MATVNLTALVATQAKGRFTAPLQMLAALITAQAKARGVTSAPSIALAALVATQAKARAATGSTNTLSARVTTMAKALPAAPSGGSQPAYFDVETLMRQTAVPAIGAMDDADVVVQASFLE